MSEYMPSVEQYTALAEAMHDGSEDCAAGYVVPFTACDCREADIEDAVRVLVGLRKADWILVRAPAETVSLSEYLAGVGA